MFNVENREFDCVALDIAPEKSYKGSFNVRLSPELHKQIAVSAKMKGISINKYVYDALKKRLLEQDF